MLVDSAQRIWQDFIEVASGLYCTCKQIQNFHTPADHCVPLLSKVAGFLNHVHHSLSSQRLLVESFIIAWKPSFGLTCTCFGDFGSTDLNL